LLIDSLQENGYHVMTPQDPAHRAGNIALICPRGEEVSAALATENIYAWGGDNRLRASIHAFVEQSDIEQFVGALKRHFPVS
jgi:selenocysteine lyase/cysteine desulfurase